MAQLKHNRFIILEALVATVVVAANRLSFITLMAGGMAFLQIMTWKQQDAVKSRVKATKNVFEKLNVIAFDKPWTVQVLAIAKSGTWFAVDLQVTGINKL